MLPFCATRAVAKSCVWKPGGKLVDELLTSIQPIVSDVTVTCSEPDFVMPLSTAVAVMVTGLALTVMPVTFAEASTCAIESLLEVHVIVAVVTVWLIESCGVALSWMVLPTTTLVGPDILT